MVAAHRRTRRRSPSWPSCAGAAWVVPDGGERGRLARRRRRHRARARALHRRRRPRPRRPQSSSTPARCCTDLDGTSLADADEPRRAHVGQPPRRLDGAAHRHLPDRRRGQPPAARRAAARSSCCAATSGTARWSTCSPTRSPGTTRARRPCSTGCSTSLLVAALRAWFARPDGAARRPGTGAQRDPVVGPALRLLHDDPARPWTVALAGRRSACRGPALARRFTELVGEPPMAFLTGWRLRSPPTCCVDPDATVAGSPARSATAARSRSARRSSATTASAPASTGPPAA